jgi:methionine-S-sulfoxide reductase
MPGVVSTRVGYAGGSKENPTYHDLGDHSEAVQIEYDPAQISYQELLDVFWSSHSATARPFSPQYASVILYHDEEQKRLALEAKEREEAKKGKPIFTEIVPAKEFTLAEAYHQKYELRRDKEILQELRSIYPDIEDFVDSTAVTRINGYLGGNGTSAQLEQEMDSLGLSPEAKDRLLKKAPPLGR